MTGVRRPAGCLAKGAAALIACALLAPAVACAQQPVLVGPRVQNSANAVVSLLAFSVVPDSTVSSLTIDRGQDKDTGLAQGQFGLGFTVDPSFPLYLEGFLGYARYDPRFVFSQGTQERRIPARWNNVSATVGIGWDFPITETLVFRPILNGAIGYIASDASLAADLLQYRTGTELGFLDGGNLLAGGLGGSVMLDYALYRPNYEIDVELRYTQLRLTSLPGTSDGVTGSADAMTLGLWARLRWPSSWEAFGRPLRWVVDFSHSQFLGPQRGALGFDHLSKLGGGIEFDVKRWGLGPDWFELQRIRLVARYLFGNNVQGGSIGIGISF
jgi:hypothetical protein